MNLFIKFAIFVAIVVTLVVLLIHLLPWILGGLAVFGLFKLWHMFNRPRRLPPPNRWPWGNP